MSSFKTFHFKIFVKNFACFSFIDFFIWEIQITLVFKLDCLYSGAQIRFLSNDLSLDNYFMVTVFGWPHSNTQECCESQEKHVKDKCKRKQRVLLKVWHIYAGNLPTLFIHYCRAKIKVL